MDNEKIYDPDHFPNLLDRINLTSHRVFEAIAPYRLEFPQTRLHSVEWGIRFPMFVEAFYDYIVKSASVPTQKLFFECYLQLNEAFFAEKAFDASIIEGLKARLCRTYPSLIRDLYFNLYVKEQAPDVRVVYNIALDVEEGIDLMIETGDSFYAVNLYADTPRARDARNAKKLRHTDFANVLYIDFPVDFRGGLKCGDFYLYGDTEFLSLKKIIGLNRSLF